MSHVPASHWAQQPPLLGAVPNDDGYDQLVVTLAIPFQGLCKDRTRPVAGAAHIGYLPAELMLDSATLGRLVEFLAARAQSQADLTRQIAAHVAAGLRPHGIGVMVEAELSCPGPFDVRAVGPVSITSMLLGTLRIVPSRRREFFALIRMSR